MLKLKLAIVGSLLLLFLFSKTVLRKQETLFACHNRMNRLNGLAQVAWLCFALLGLYGSKVEG